MFVSGHDENLLMTDGKILMTNNDQHSELVKQHQGNAAERLENRTSTERAGVLAEQPGSVNEAPGSGGFAKARQDSSD